MNWLIGIIGIAVLGYLVYIYRTEEMGDANKKSNSGSNNNH